jgi:hypothetical protein
VSALLRVQTKSAFLGDTSQQGHDSLPGAPGDHQVVGSIQHHLGKLINYRQVAVRAVFGRKFRDHHHLANRQLCVRNRQVAICSGSYLH